MTARSIPFSGAKESNETTIQGTARPLQLSNKDISRFRSIVTAPLKGIAKSSLGLGKLAYILSDPSGKLKKYAEPLFEKAQEKIEERMPTHPEALEKGLERAGGIAGGLMLTGGAALPSIGRGLLGGAAGQAIEEIGGGPISQAAGEIAASSLPSLARRIIPSSVDQARILETGRRYGMTEEQLAPLMPEVKKRRFFGKYAFAGEETGEKLKETGKGISNIYDVLESSPKAQRVISPQATHDFVTEIDRLSMRMPHNIRSQLKNDAMDLVRQAQRKGGFTGQDLMNFYHDISSRYNLGRQQLELFKDPVKKAIGSIDPELGKDFETVNRMFQKKSQIGRILKPSEYEHLISLGEAYELGASVGNLDVGRLGRLLGMVGFRKFSEKMLTSPRFQNIIEKTQNALMKNDINALGKLGSLIYDELEEYEESSQE